LREVPVMSRYQRLASRVATLYHQTDVECAKSILDSQHFRKGEPSSIAGAGIYFATSPEDTNHKAHKKGVILQARVKLGNVKQIGSKGDKSITFESLSAEGYDSILIPRSGGDEYVVYDYDQVDQIEVHSITDCADRAAVRKNLARYIDLEEEVDYDLVGSIGIGMPVIIGRRHVGMMPLVGAVPVDIGMIGGPMGVGIIGAPMGVRMMGGPMGVGMMGRPMGIGMGRFL
jgi:hypothetical protein